MAGIASEVAKEIMEIETRQSNGYAYGMDDEFLQQAKRWGHISENYTKEQLWDTNDKGAKAQKVLEDVFKNAGFKNIKNDTIAKFYFDCFIHKKSVCYAIMTVMHNQDYKLLAYDTTPFKPKIFEEINATKPDDINNYISSILFIRYVMTLFSHSKGAKQGIWNKRVYPLYNKGYKLDCVDSKLYQRLLDACDYVYNNNKHIGLGKQRLSRIGIKKIIVTEFPFLEGINKIASVYTESNCVMAMPENYMFPPKTEQTNVIVPILLFISITKILKLW